MNTTTWAMKSIYGTVWIAIDPAQAVDALEVGIPIKLTTTDELLEYSEGGQP